MKPNLFALLLFFPIYIFAQDRDYSKTKFGDVTEKDFAAKVYSIDSSADAVVIADIGSSEIEGNNKSGFSLLFKRFRRVHILKKSAFDFAEIHINLRNDMDREEKIDKLRATTYNMEDGKVVATKLDPKTGIFKEKLDKEHSVSKFTFPSLKEGSIIEYEYIVRSDYWRNLRSWEFQGLYPRLWSEYTVSFPDFLGYVTLTQGYQKMDVTEGKSRRVPFSVMETRQATAAERYEFTSDVVDKKWSLKNVPALKEEKFTTSIDNHIDKIEFQLVELREPLNYRRLIESWAKVSEDMMNDEYFGQQLTKDNGWLKDYVAPLKLLSKNKTELAKRIFEYVRDNFTCTSYYSLYLDQALKTLAKTRKGTSAEINLLLAAMLRYADIEANPVILSTRSNGTTYQMYPVLNQYNYVVTLIYADDKTYFLDASEPHLGFGFLPLSCYNGHARVMNAAADATFFYADSVKETKNTSVFVVNDEKGNLVGSKQQTPGYYESMEIRNLLLEKGKDALLKDIQKELGSDYAISNFGVDSLSKYDEPLNLHYDFDFKGEKEDIIYLNPMFGEGLTENPFKSAERFYPVEMPYTQDKTYNLQLEVPEGYVVDELPKPMMLKLNEDGDGLFEYRVSQSGNNISFRCRIKLSRANFVPDEYEMLREFFNLIVKKQSEQIVFKKKK